MASLGDDVVAAIPDTEIQPPIWSQAKAMEVVTTKCHPDSVTTVQRLAIVRATIVIRVVEHPQIGNAGEIDIAAMRQHSRASSINHIVEMVGEDRGVICPAVTVTVRQQPNSVVILCVFRELF